MFELNSAFQGSSSHCTKPVFFKLCMDKVMSMHNEKKIKTCYEWSRKGIEEKQKKSNSVKGVVLDSLHSFFLY